MFPHCSVDYCVLLCAKILLEGEVPLKGGFGELKKLETMETKQKIGQVIQQRRKNLRISQKQLAELAEIGINTLYKIEIGKANPTLESLQKITDILGLEITLQAKKV